MYLTKFKLSGVPRRHSHGVHHIRGPSLYMLTPLHLYLTPGWCKGLHCTSRVFDSYFWRGSVTPAVPRCLFLIHSTLASTYLSFALRHVSTCSAQTSTPVTCRPPAAHAPARALYKEVRGQRSVATPHTPFLLLFSCFFCFFFSFLCFLCAPRISYSVCTCLLLGYGPRVHRLNTFSRHNRCTGYGVFVPCTAHGRTRHHTKLLSFNDNMSVSEYADDSLL